MFSASRKNGEVSVVYDICADSVGAAVLLSAKGGMPHIVYVCREYFFPNGAIEQSARRMISAMRETLYRLDEHIRRRILRHDFFDSYSNKNVYFSFSSPWIESKPKNLTAEKFLSKLSSDFGVPKGAFVIIEDAVALPREIHDIVSSLHHKHKILSFDRVVSETVDERLSGKDVTKKLLGSKVSTSNSISADPAFLILAARVGKDLLTK